MPQKKNPVVLEYLKGKSGHLLGLLCASLSTIKGTNFTHTGDASRQGMRGFWEAGKECLRCLRLLDLVVRSATPNPQAMAQRVRRDFSSATDLADLLVRRCGLSFRESHHVIGAVVRLAMDRSLGADDIGIDILNEAARDQLGGPLDLGDLEVRHSLDPLASVNSRLVPGGPAPIRVRERVAELESVSADDKERNEIRRKNSIEARDALKQAIRRLSLNPSSDIRTESTAASIED